ncbi:penicillin-binding protein 2 [Nocardioides perillae]|uniref:Penicillin-binding protein 2 n=1 Tax=Nocardioides perillae TaxID=1119534 RepID=A0A7Y9UMU7_9ACTN|nr:penicillin-binding protein 2 [Nocardioides perillae]NYG56502.1 penicillin-binding protein 2 [Nocardioides perillae]
MTVGAGRPDVGAERSRVRLVVVQALVFSLFATLLARLWFLQVLDGEEYRAQAASQSVREVVVQPQRGLIVDAQGRPLVANRPSWVVSVDRTLLGRMGEDEQAVVLRRVAAEVDLRPARLRRALLDCGVAGSIAGECWNGSPYQPVPVATDVPEQTALRILEQPEDFPAVLVEQQTVRAYPEPFGVNAAHLLGYLSPITEDELDAAEAADDRSVNGASSVGRAGVEKQYDAWLRGMPGYRRVAVDSMGRTLDDAEEVEGVPGSTLVTSIDAKVQSVVEQQLAQTIATARATLDTVTGRRYVADSGAAVVLEADTGRVVAMASQPTYDPGVWVGGISSRQLARLYSEAAGTPLLSRATQGQFAPGSTWKPFMTAGAMQHGYDEDTRLACSSGFQVGNRVFKNYESGAYGSISFAKALEVSCNTFFYRIGYDYWQRLGSDVDDVAARDPLVREAQEWGFGAETGIDVPGEAAGRIADRQWKRDYYESQKDYYCAIAAKPRSHPDNKGVSDFVHRFAEEFCVEGYAYRAGDAVNFAIGQGDTIVTPLQLARAYGAIANGGTLYEPRVGKAVVGPDGSVVQRIPPVVQGRVDAPRDVLRYLDAALTGVAANPQGTMNWRLGGFPLDQVRIRAKTGSAEVYGKQSTSWVASYTDDYVVVMMVSQGGTGSGTSGPAIRAIYEALYGVQGEQVRPAAAAIPGTVPPRRLPRFELDGSILPPVVRRAAGARS